MNFSHIGVGFAHPHQQAIVYKNSRRGTNVEMMPPPPPKQHSVVRQLSRNAQQAIVASEQKVERQSITQYTFTGPVMLNPRTLPECQSTQPPHALRARCDAAADACCLFAFLASDTRNYSRYFLCVLHRELKLTDLVRVLTFIETDLHSMFPHTLMTCQTTNTTRHERAVDQASMHNLTSSLWLRC